jgi:hypothetical protein
MRISGTLRIAKPSLRSILRPTNSGGRKKRHSVRSTERCESCKCLILNGAPCKTRTCDLLVRSQTLYPTELRALRGNARLSRGRSSRNCFYISSYGQSRLKLMPRTRSTARPLAHRLRTSRPSPGQEAGAMTERRRPPTISHQFQRLTPGPSVSDAAEPGPGFAAITGDFELARAARKGGIAHADSVSPPADDGNDVVVLDARGTTLAGPVDCQTSPLQPPILTSTPAR